MENQRHLKLNKVYFYSVLLLMLVFPAISILADYIHQPGIPFVALTGKWFIFWAIGVRLFTAGIRQVAKPLFTLTEIFHIQNSESQVIVRELGFANSCFGVTGILAMFIATWQPAAGFIGGLYMGIAGIYHIVKKPAGANEIVAMVSDLFIFLVMVVYLGWYFIYQT